MKAMKLMMMAVITVFLGTGLTSCLNSNNEMPYDFGDYVTLQQTMYGEAYKCDYFGYIVYPTNGTTIFGNDFPERAFLYFKLAEGEVLTEDKKQYNATIVEGSRILIKDFCDRVDTLKLNNGQRFNKIEAWPTDNYLNVGFTVPYTPSKTNLNLFNVYPTKAEGDKLYVKLINNEDRSDSYYQTINLVINYRLPYSSHLKSLLGDAEYNKLQFFGSNNDSINLVLEADGTENNTLSTTTKVRIQR